MEQRTTGLEGVIGTLREIRAAQQPQMRPATLAQARALLQRPPVSVGDIVVLKAEFRGIYKWPTDNERCIVTQVLDRPIHRGETGTNALARRLDIALAFYDANDGTLCEYLHDGRMFNVVGSVYDPVQLPDGESLAVA